MKKLLVAAVVGASALQASPAFAQAVPAPTGGKVSKAVADTVAASVKRRCVTDETGAEFCPGGGSFNSAETQAAVRKTLDRIADNFPTYYAAGSCAASVAGQHWGALIRNCLPLAMPIKIGRAGFDIGSFGGGGATGSWDRDGSGRFDCGDLDIRFDVQGNLIVPSMPLPSGVAMEIGTQANPRVLWFHGGPTGSGFAQIHAKEQGMLAKRWMHLTNVQREPRAWYGARDISIQANGDPQVNFATVAYRNEANNIVGRQAQSVGGTKFNADNYHNATNDIPHYNCPRDPASGGAGFDFYGYNPTSWLTHMHNCTWFVPDTSLSSSGYALNDFTTIPAFYFTDGTFPGAAIPEHLAHCPLDLALVAALSDKLLKDAAAKPGYDGVNYDPVKPEDARPGDSTVNDLREPHTPLPNGDPDTPVPTAPNPPAPVQTGYQDECDFGPTGCTNPNTAAPDLDEAPTNIMDPIFDWLPDLPSITLGDNSSACPIWNLNLTAYGGSDWQFLIDGHCALVEHNTGHGTVRELIGALMVAVWGIGAAIVILRA